LSDNYDRFDKFFFYTLKYLLPSLYLENFDTTFCKYRIQLKRYSKIKYLCSEAWLSNSEINFFRAVAYEIKGVKTIYNEHNCFFHPFSGDIVSLKSTLVDIYLTLGWERKEKNFISAASLFEFSIPLKKKRHNILYVSYTCEQIINVYSPTYAFQGGMGLSYLEFIKGFFQLLPISLLNQISYRGYPTDYFNKGIRFNKEGILNDYLKYVKIVSSSKNVGKSCKQQMACSRLIVIDFLSTAYLESLQMNIPTIVLFDPNSMCMDKRYTCFFDDLIKAKIIHETPESAVNHLLEVYHKPQEWWQSKNVQSLKNKWLKTNFGDPNILLNFLLELAN